MARAQARDGGAGRHVVLDGEVFAVRREAHTLLGGPVIAETEKRDPREQRATLEIASAASSPARGTVNRMAIKTKSTVGLPAQPGPLTVLVDADEFDQALVDPRVQQTNVQATEFLERLEREGRSL